LNLCRRRETSSRHLGRFLLAALIAFPWGTALAADAPGKLTGKAILIVGSQDEPCTIKRIQVPKGSGKESSGDALLVESLNGDKKGVTTMVKDKVFEIGVDRVYGIFIGRSTFARTIWFQVQGKKSRKPFVVSLTNALDGTDLLKVGLLDSKGPSPLILSKHRTTLFLGDVEPDKYAPLDLEALMKDKRVVPAGKCAILRTTRDPVTIKLTNPNPARPTDKKVVCVSVDGGAATTLALGKGLELGPWKTVVLSYDNANFGRDANLFFEYKEDGKDRFDKVGLHSPMGGSILELDFQGSAYYNFIHVGPATDRPEIFLARNQLRRDVWKDLSLPHDPLGDDEDGLPIWQMLKAMVGLGF